MSFPLLARCLCLGMLWAFIGGTAAAQPPPGTVRSFPKNDPDTPTVKALNRVLADPQGFHIPDIAKMDLVPVFLVAAGHSERFWEQANFKEKDRIRDLSLGTYIGAEGGLFGGKVGGSYEYRVGGTFIAKTRESLTVRTTVAKVPDDGRPYWPSKGPVNVLESTRENPFYLRCQVTGNVIIDDIAKGYVRHKAELGFRAETPIFKGGVTTNYDHLENDAKGKSDDAGGIHFSDWIRLPPGRYTSQFAQSLCRAYAEEVRDAVLSDRRAQLQDFYAFVDDVSTCLHDSDCTGKVNMDEEITKVLGKRPQSPRAHALLRVPSRAEEEAASNSQKRYDLVFDHLEKRGRPACVDWYDAKWRVQRRRCGLGLERGGLCFRNPPPSETVGPPAPGKALASRDFIFPRNASEAMERAHEQYVGHRWEFPCQRGLGCHLGRCRTAAQLREAAAGLETPPKGLAALPIPDLLEALDRESFFSVSHQTGAIRVAGQAEADRQKALDRKAYEAAYSNPTSRLLGDFHRLNDAFLGKRVGPADDHGFLVSPKLGAFSKGRPFDSPRLFHRGTDPDRTELERRLDDILADAIAPEPFLLKERLDLPPLAR